MKNSQRKKCFRMRRSKGNKLIWWYQIILYFTISTSSWKRSLQIGRWIFQKLLNINRQRKFSRNTESRKYHRSKPIQDSKASKRRIASGTLASLDEFDKKLPKIAKRKSNQFCSANTNDSLTSSKTILREETINHELTVVNVFASKMCSNLGCQILKNSAKSSQMLEIYSYTSSYTVQL